MRPLSLAFTAALALAPGAALVGCHPSYFAEPLPEEAPPDAGLARQAPAELSFETTHVVELRLSQAELTTPGELLHLKVALDPGLLAQVFLGRVPSDRELILRLSVARTTEVLYYELYDETGFAARGVRAPARVDAS